ncbi:hypothetical protein IW261DRAFT_1419763 [Armillaria novae-zelandiae]|uniref:Uncharacterized protein n=1 Tax=Armillaria novae-zelandiae TaxID=153914 RepID=A0AA39P8R5_9AGAR|nr:hypothetical protein IW261DRAFT_1419763 [Armillaria novae-zelandiae]
MTYLRSGFHSLSPALVMSKGENNREPPIENLHTSYPTPHLVASQSMSQHRNLPRKNGFGRERSRGHALAPIGLVGAKGDLWRIFDGHMTSDPSRWERVNETVKVPGKLNDRYWQLDWHGFRVQYNLMFRGHFQCGLHSPLGPNDPDRGGREKFSTTWLDINTLKFQRTGSLGDPYEENCSQDKIKLDGCWEIQYVALELNLIPKTKEVTPQSLGKLKTRTSNIHLKILCIFHIQGLQNSEHVSGDGPDRGRGCIGRKDDKHVE